MKHAIGLSLIACCALLGAASANAQKWVSPKETDNPDVSVWGCYNAKPGHPTADEKTAFIKAASLAAVAAEEKYGVPAPAIAAMAILESGYGWTRTALFANNYFGWKEYTKAKQAGAYKLWCQDTASDENENYVIFRSLAASMSNTARNLKTSNNYKADTAKFQAAMASGQDRRVAVMEWISGISAPYNGAPAEYVKTLKRVINDPVSWSDAENAASTLFLLTPRINAAAAADTRSRSTAAALAYLDGKRTPASKTNLSASRYMEGTCAASPAEWTGYEGRAVQRCEYTSEGLKGVVYMLNPTGAQLAAWVGGACAGMQSLSPEECGDRLARLVVGQNGGQYPVAGLVVEREKDAGGTGPTNDPVYLEFRDGVTVVTADNLHWRKTAATTEEAESSAKAAIKETRSFARVANASRDAYRLAGGKEKVGASAEDDKSHLWLDVSRRSYLAALDGGDYQLLLGYALSLTASNDLW